MSSPAVLRGSKCPRTPARSKSISAASMLPVPATTKTRRRRWGTPKYCASRMRQATRRRSDTTPASVHLPPAGCNAPSDPQSAPRRHPKALSWVLRTPGTFSHTATAGDLPPRRRTTSTASKILTNSKVKFPRASSRLPRRPATENAWHGVPPTSTSGASMSPANIPLMMRVMSP